MILGSFSAFLGSVWFSALTFCLGVAGGVYLVKRGIIK